MQPSAPPPEPEPTIGAPADESLSAGTAVAVLREAWPSYACHELGGQAWQASVVARARGRAIVKFTHARTRDGRRYENANIGLVLLRLLDEARSGGQAATG